jgi:hypothetical protein
LGFLFLKKGLRVKFLVNLIELDQSKFMKKHRRYVILLILLSLKLALAIPQNYTNIFNITYFYLPVVSLDNIDVNYRDYSIETCLPYKLKNGNIFGIKPQYESITLIGENTTLKNLHLQSLECPVFALIKYKNPKWSSYTEFVANLNSDFVDIEKNQFQVGATVLFFYEKRKDFTWQFGVYYNQETFGPYPMILLGLDWKIDTKNYFSVILPAYLIYERKLSPKFYTGFEVELSGETYRLGGSTYENSYISQFGQNKLSFVTEPRLFLDYYIAKHMVFYVKPGWRFLQKYEQYDEHNKRIKNSEYVQGQLENTFYIEAGFAYRFRYDEPTLPSDNTTK